MCALLSEKEHVEVTLRYVQSLWAKCRDWSRNGDDTAWAASRAVRAQLFRTDVVDQLVAFAIRGYIPGLPEAMKIGPGAMLTLLGKIGETHEERAYITSCGFAAALAAVTIREPEIDHGDALWPANNFVFYLEDVELAPLVKFAAAWLTRSPLRGNDHYTQMALQILER